MSDVLNPWRTSTCNVEQVVRSALRPNAVTCPTWRSHIPTPLNRGWSESVRPHHGATASYSDGQDMR